MKRHPGMLDAGELESCLVQLEQGKSRARPAIRAHLTAQDAEIDRLRCALEGAKDWAARSGATGLERWCAEALSPTGKLAVFPPFPNATTQPPRIEHGRRWKNRRQGNEVTTISTHAGRVVCEHPAGGLLAFSYADFYETFEPLDDELVWANR